MPVEDPKDLERVDREIRINELQEEASELTVGKMHGWESDNYPPEIAESFWQKVVDYEKAPRTCHLEQLVIAGVDMPPAESMTDEMLSAKLWEVIHRLAERRVFITIRITSANASSTFTCGRRACVKRSRTCPMMSTHPGRSTSSEGAARRTSICT